MCSCFRQINRGVVTHVHVVTDDKMISESAWKETKRFNTTAADGADFIDL